MIKINLLPLDKRRADRTPIGRFLLILLGVAVGCSMAAAMLWLWFLKIGPAEEERAQLTAYNDGAEAGVIKEKYARLKGEEDAFKARKDTIEKLKPSFRWSDIVDVICERLHTLHPKIWITGMRVLEPPELATEQQTMGLSFKPLVGFVVDCQSATWDPEPLLNFRRDVQLKAAEEKKPAGAPGEARPKMRALIDYFDYGIFRLVTFELKDQKEYQERFSQQFQLRFYVEKGPPR